MIVNNAGLLRFNPMTGWTKSDWVRLLEVDLVGAAPGAALAVDGGRLARLRGYSAGAASGVRRGRDRICPIARMLT